MQLTSITLHNFKVHRDLHLDLLPGVTGIVGKNGKGKSSILSAIDFLVTGTTDTDQKSDCITLGESEGWVSGNFLLHDKQGYIERHLSVSKVVLRYDGKTLNKATEVKELWATLLQIDPVIFKNVIIAGQGVIPLLFSGDQSVREKIFQRIFMVPATEKTRGIIWDKYIKLAPPERLIEDASVLEARQVEVAVKSNQLQRSADECMQHILGGATLTGVNTRITFLDKCIRDAYQRPELELQLGELMALQTSYQTRLTSELTVDASTLPALKVKQLTLLKAAQAFQTYTQLVKQHQAAIAGWSVNEIAEAEQQQVQADLVELQLNDEKLQLDILIRTGKDKIAQLGLLLGHATCPTCKQTVNNPLEAIQQIKEELAGSQALLVGLLPKLAAARGLTSVAQNRRFQLVGQQQNSDALRVQLDNCTVVAPVEAELCSVTTEVEELEQKVRLRQQVELQAAQLNGAIENLRGRLNNLGSYDADGTPEEELALMHSVLLVNQERHATIAELKLQQGQCVKEIELLDERIACAKTHKASNEQRRKYLDTLQGIYDLFGTTVFPRMLVESYGKYVEKYLQINLDHFHIPFKAHIASGFKIEMLDSAKRPLPTLSGGQNVIVGICLRLALHRMFAQSFPMWLVDEGTTHLDDENRRLYFQLIEQLKRDAVIKQLIIIDHDGQLANVVDRVITIPIECTS